MCSWLKFVPVSSVLATTSSADMRTLSASFSLRANEQNRQFA